MTRDTIAVTGAAGFIGRWVVAELLDRGYAVRGLDDLSNGSCRNVAEFESTDEFSLTVGDISKPDVADDLLGNDVEACINLAAEIDVQESLNDPESHFETNVVGTEHVLEACRATDTCLGLVGTCMISDMVDSEEGIDESHPVKPASPYAGTKLAAENIAESYYHGYDLPVTILRPFNIYGPYQKTGMAGGVVSIFTSRDIKREPLKIFGDGIQTRDLMFDTVALLNIVQIIEREIEEHDPDIVYTHHYGDLNVDHELACRATVTATRPLADSSIECVLACETLSATEWSVPEPDNAFQPTSFVNIDDNLSTKLDALAVYEIELRESLHPRTPETAEQNARVGVRRWACRQPNRSKCCVPCGGR